MHHFDYRNGVLHAEGVNLIALAEAVGTPFYCYASATLERHYKVFAGAFADVDALVCYAMKANSNQAVIATLAKLGAGADVVSGGELLRARAAGIAPAKIMFSGVGKTARELAQAVDEGILCVNVESEAELEMLSAIAAAKGLGAIVRAFDVRPEVADQIKSLGGEFLTVDIQESGAGTGGYAKQMSKEFIEAEMALFRAQAKDVNIVITTALIPGKPAPKLWMTDMVELMRPGSVVVDLAAENGGNCELTEAGKTVVSDNGVKVISPVNLPSDMAADASQLYSKNVENLLGLLLDDEGHLALDFDDEVVAAACITHEGEIRNERAAGRQADS